MICFIYENSDNDKEAHICVNPHVSFIAIIISAYSCNIFEIRLNIFKLEIT